MKKEYKKRKDESLAQWVDRLAPACCGRSLSEVHDILHELSVQSYIAGTQAESQVRLRSATLTGRKRI